MGWVLFHINERGTPHKLRWYKTHKGAKIGRGAANRNAGGFAYDILEESVFDASFNKKTTVKSLMTGKDVVINEQDRGGPCDPSTERFWSM